MTRGVPIAVEQAWQWLQRELGGAPVPPLLALIGAGDGYVLDALERHAPATKVLVLEPDPAQAARFLARRNWDAWRDARRLSYLIDPGYVGADEAWRLFPPFGGEPPVLLYPGQPHNEGLGRAAQTLKRIFYGVEANARARLQFAPRYLTNVIRNLPAAASGRDVRALTGKFAGIPAVIVAAGPSLDAQLAEVVAARDRALIISTDTALRPLLNAGLQPPLVAALDPSDANLRHFRALPDCGRTWLVSEAALARDATAVFGRRTLWFRAGDHQPWPWLRQHGFDIGLLDVWGSVLTAAFQVAWLAGCDPIVTVGADLSYTHRRPYARGTTYEVDWAAAVAQGHTLQQAWDAQMARGRLVQTPDVHGDETTSTASLLSFRDWLVARAARCGRRVINATGGGIFFGEAIAQMPLEEALPRRMAIAAIDDLNLPAAGPSPGALATWLGSAHDAVQRGSDESPVDAWKAFSGPGFDTTAVVAALGAAVSELQTGLRPPAPDAVDWGVHLQSSPLKHVLPQWPEAVEHFTSALAGERLVATSAAAATPADSLDVALDMLADLLPRVFASEDVTFAHDPASGRIPVSVLCWWPEPVRWALLAIEALLGTAWPTSTPSVPAPLLSRQVRLSDAVAAERMGLARPASEVACSILVEQWWRCASTLPPAAAIRLRHEATRRLTSVQPGDNDPARRARWMTGTRRAATGGRDGELLMLPHVLSVTPLERGFVAYRSSDSVVCIPPGANTSVIIQNARDVVSHVEWPRPIDMELPFGDTGTIAWSSGLGTPGHTPYVMYRATAAQEPVIEDLPVRPTTGVVTADRVYWICLAGGDLSWTGIASWRPNEPVRLELDGVAPLALLPEGAALGLEPCVRRADLGFEHVIATAGARWMPGSLPTPIAAGELGGASSRDTHGEWTATAHPQADAIRFTASDGRQLDMICHCPFRLAWQKHSLIVSTIEREVLVFAELVPVLEAATRP